MVFREGDRGCASDTPAAQLDDNGNVIATGQQRYLRIRINNEGCSAAHGVNLCITEISFYPVIGNANVFDASVLKLAA